MGFPLIKVRAVNTPLDGFPSSPTIALLDGDCLARISKPLAAFVRTLGGGTLDIAILYTPFNVIYIIIDKRDYNMPKQNIYIGTKGGNERIEKAIPKLMKKEGWGKAQATAVAIRLESIGRLGGMGGVTKEPVNAGLIVAASMLKNRQPKTTKQKTINTLEASSPRQYKRKISRTRTTKPKKRL
tara:strand:- start:36 stop:587 length:552 start_codon:yes stop_codon:yes gene_type:complete